MSRITVVGDVLLDRDLDGTAERLAPDAPVPVVGELTAHERPGGAGLAALLAARDGHDVDLVCALGRDPAGERVRALLAAEGVAVHDLGHDGATPEKVRVRAGGRPVVRLDGGGTPGPCGPLTAAARDALLAPDAVLVADYGRGVPAAPRVRDALARLPGSVPLVWDPHPRGAAPVPGAALATPNRAESGADGTLAGAERRARRLARDWRAAHVAITLGARGALLVGGDGPPLVVPAPPAAGDPCGAGDCFATAATGVLACGGLPSEAVREAVRTASAFVAAGGAAAVAGDDRPACPGAPDDAATLAARVRARGGTVVATGGCFDLLHAGHVRMLQTARSLGDCLIVCLNSDASVRRLKGSDRPLVAEQDRAAVLAALACVDAVAVFAEDDPRTVLRELRPHVWAKGGDYAIADLPERDVLAEWGGQAVLVPYVAGKSTTRMIEVARGA